MEDFGVIVICTKYDLWMAKGCCASIRYFMPDTPICLLVDGEFDLEGLDKVYNTKVIRKQQLKNAFLKENSYGWGTTRMIAFWESPFKSFLLIDADTLTWGDLRKKVDVSKHDLIVDKPEYNYPDEAIETYFFPIEGMQKHFPHFEVRKHPYVCPAVLIGKKGIFSIEEYQAILKFHHEHPDFFKCGDMGFFNYMIFDMKEKEKLNLASADIQYLMRDFKKADNVKRFPMTDEGPAENENTPPTIIHWAGSSKPYISNKEEYAEPMTFFRKKFLEDKGVPKDDITKALLKEERKSKRDIWMKFKKKRVRQFLPF